MQLTARLKRFKTDEPKEPNRPPKTELVFDPIADAAEVSSLHLLLGHPVALTLEPED